MDPELRKVEERLAAIAGANHGIVTREQMLRAEISDQEIKGRVGNGSLIRVHRGVYRVGHAAPSVDARYMAAVLACGHGAVLSGLPAAWMYRLIKGNPRRPEVTAPTERRVAGVIVHRSRIIRVSELRGVPIATVPDTLIAITSRLDEPDLGRAVHEARVLYGTKPEHIPKPWPKKLRLILNGDTRITLSEL